MRAVRNTPRSQDLSNLSLAQYRETQLEFGVFFYKYLPGQTSQSASGDCDAEEMPNAIFGRGGAKILDYLLCARGQRDVNLFWVLFT